MHDNSLFALSKITFLAKLTCHKNIFISNLDFILLYYRKRTTIMMNVNFKIKILRHFICLSFFSDNVTILNVNIFKIYLWEKNWGWDSFKIIQFIWQQYNKFRPFYEISPPPPHPINMINYGWSKNLNRMLIQVKTLR